MLNATNTTPTLVITLDYIIFFKLLAVSACQCPCCVRCPYAYPCFI